MRRPRKSINQINVVPYIDVMLVLLVIFMVTAPLITPGEIELPTVGSTLPTPVAPLYVTLNADKSLSLSNGSSAASVRVSQKDLVARLLDAQAKTPGQAVVISAKGTAQYQDVIDIVDLLQRNQIQKVGLMAQQRSN